MNKVKYLDGLIIPLINSRIFNSSLLGRSKPNHYLFKTFNYLCYLLVVPMTHEVSFSECSGSYEERILIKEAHLYETNIKISHTLAYIMEMLAMFILLTSMVVMMH